MASKSLHWLHQFQLATEHSLKGATNYGKRATGVGTKHAVKGTFLSACTKCCCITCRLLSTKSIGVLLTNTVGVLQLLNFRRNIFVFMRREFVVRVIGTLLVVLYILVNKLV